GGAHPRRERQRRRRERRRRERPQQLPRPPLRGDGELSAAQVERERSAPPGGALDDGEPARLLAPALQRQRHRLQHAPADLPGKSDRGFLRLPAGGAVQRNGRGQEPAQGRSQPAERLSWRPSTSSRPAIAGAPSSSSQPSSLSSPGSASAWTPASTASST